MRIEFARKIEKFVKAKINRLFIKEDDFSIISNNCWGTFLYKKYGIPYKSPFVNLLLFAPDYIKLVKNFSIETLEKLSFIEHSESKFKDELIRIGIYEDNYPIGVIDQKYEVHFLHYKTKEDAYDKWMRRIKRINPNKLVFKFSDGDLFEEWMGKEFCNLPYKNKIMFTSKELPEVDCNVYLPEFASKGRVRDEWKYSAKYFNSNDFINGLK
ncbi:DUF1919 domain-containing protein [Sulfurimonas microaerophilic]|uniref:DUF1919 domain-containing protein n=1 Tax=Sulfurimonas microaerophilic TaxID=3058392 RepID=UPI002714BF95|nr:DUF1919 domain-containing protein [Sulfurimonas sp. hsl 1-7]